MMAGASAMKVEYRYLRSYRTQHGTSVTYYRRNGRNRRLHASPGSAEFQREYDEASAWFEGGGIATTLPRVGARPKPHTVRWLVVEYFSSPHFRQLDAATTQRQRTRVLERVCLEPVRPGASVTMGEVPLAHFDSKAIRALRDRHADRREAARHMMKAISQMFDWALENDVAGVTRNPVRDVKYPKPLATGGHHTWTPDEVRQYEQRHPIGSKARLALALLIYLGLRASDVVRLGKRHVSEGTMTLTLHKNRQRRPVTLRLPILPELQRIMDASELGAMTFLQTDHGKPFASAKSFGNKVHDWCEQAGLSQCTAHGLRKAGATIAATNGATPHQLKAIFGWTTLKQPELYTRAIEQERVAAEAMPLMVARKRPA
jgi:integrase